jgi:predicted Fe-Mo cluster-binding NifX family protein
MPGFDGTGPAGMGPRVFDLSGGKATSRKVLLSDAYPVDIAENIMTTGIDSSAAIVGAQITIGAVKLRIVERGKPEHGPGDYSFYGVALLAEEGIFTEVIESGYIAEGDTISVCSNRKEKFMKVGFAVEINEGLQSMVYGHFGSAPAFIIVDTEGEGVMAINNRDLNHVHGACNPVMALDGKSVDAMVVGGIGAGALVKLNAIGIKVFGAAAPTVRENLVLLMEGGLQELSVDNSCRAHQGGCGH